MRNKGKVRDYGSTNRIRSIVNKSICNSLRCRLCDHVQYAVPSELNRANAVKCDKCGGPVDFTNAEQKRRIEQGYISPPKSERKCEICGCRLRTGNIKSTCAPCDKSAFDEKMLRG